MEGSKVTLEYVETNPNDVPDSMAVQLRGLLPRHCTPMVIKQSIPVTPDTSNRTSFKFYMLPTIEQHRQIAYANTADAAGFSANGTDMDNAANLTNDYGYWRCIAMGLRFVPSANSNNDQGEVTAISSAPMWSSEGGNDAATGYYMDLDDMCTSSDMMNQRGFVKAPARMGLEVVWRPFKYDLHYYEDGHIGAVGAETRTAMCRHFNYDPKAFRGVGIEPDVQMSNINRNTFGYLNNRFRDVLPALCLSGNGFAGNLAVPQWGTIETTVIGCFVARNKSVASHVEDPVYLGGPLVAGNAMSTTRTRKEAIVSTVIAKIRRRAERVRHVIDVGGSIAQSLAPFVAMANPAVGAALAAGGGSVRALSQMSGSELASDLVKYYSDGHISSVRSG